MLSCPVLNFAFLRIILNLDCYSNVFCNYFSSGGGPVQWDFVHGLFENAIYGGRVDNNFDVRVLSSYLRQYFTDGQFSGAVSSRQNILIDFVNRDIRGLQS